MARTLTEADVIRLRRLFWLGKTHQELATMFNVSKAHVTRVIVGVRWQDTDRKQAS